MPITDETKQDLELLTGETLSPEDWHLVRKSLRCLVRGQKCVVHDGRERVEPPTETLRQNAAAEAMTERAAVRAVVEAARKKKVSVVEAARSLVVEPKKG
jgi:uncharacterized membrane protein